MEREREREREREYDSYKRGCENTPGWFQLFVSVRVHMRVSQQICEAMCAVRGCLYYILVREEIRCCVS